MTDGWDGAFTPGMVHMAKAIALSIDNYSARQREAICKHAIVCAVINEAKMASDIPYAFWLGAEAEAA